MAERAELAALLEEVLRSHREEQRAQLQGWLQNLDGLIKQSTFHLTSPATVVLSEPRLEQSQADVPSSNAGASEGLGLDAALPQLKVSPRNSHKQSLERSESYELAIQESHRLHDREKASGVIHVDSTPEAEWRARHRGVSHWCLRIADSVAFEAVFGIAILTNAVYLGWQLEWARNNDGQADFGAESLTVQLMFAVLFSIEMLIRLLARGPRHYIFGRDRLWNWLDMFVVTSSWIVIAVEVLIAAGIDEASNSQLRIFRVFKVSRLLRVVGSLWVVRSVKALRQLVNSLVDTLKSLFWALVLLFLIIYTFGILFTDAAIDHRRKQGPHPALDLHFGSLYASVTTLLRSILGGLDWFMAADALETLGLFWVQVFNFYVCFCTFAVLNVMTGVFCNSAIKAAERDHDTLMQNRHEFRVLAHDLFSKMDSSGLGRITISEFERLFGDEAMIAFLETAEINANDAWTLFASLDVDGDYVIGIDEFTERCMQLHGPARAVDVFGLQRYHVKYREQLQDLETCFRKLDNKINYVVGACHSLVAPSSNPDPDPDVFAL